MAKENNILSVRSKGEKIFFTIAFIVLVIHSISLLVPVAWMLISSLKTAKEYMFESKLALPEKWLFKNYIDAFTLLDNGSGVNFLGMIVNSVLYTSIATFLNIMMPLICGYTMSKYTFKGRELIYTVAVTAMVIPIVGTGAANMRFLKMVNFYDNVLYIIWSFSGGFTASFLVYYGFYKSVSWSYAEAAQIDGANHFLIFFKIMLPQALPIMMTYAITSSIGHWSDYQNVLLCLPSYPTLAAGLFQYQTIIGDRGGDYPKYFAGLVMSMIPTLVLFASFSSKIMTNISIGGLKG